MRRGSANGDLDPEVVAMGRVLSALRDLDQESQARVLEYVAAKLKIGLRRWEDVKRSDIGESGYERPETETRERSPKAVDLDEIEAVSPIARKWMTRNGLKWAQLSQVFSLSGDEIDLIANTVPGNRKSDRMRNVFLLKGVAAYLGGGAARFSHQQIKEACLHYDAFDPTNFSHYFKKLSGEVSGSKESGYLLTARGLTNATELVKSLTQGARA